MRWVYVWEFRVWNFSLGFVILVCQLGVLFLGFQFLQFQFVGVHVWISRCVELRINLIIWFKILGCLGSAFQLPYLFLGSVLVFSFAIPIWISWLPGLGSSTPASWLAPSSKLPSLLPPPLSSWSLDVALKILHIRAPPSRALIASPRPITHPCW